MNIKDVISYGLGVVGVIFSAFGGFLFDLAPPAEAVTGFSVGVSSFILLVAFLGIRVLLQFKVAEARRRKIWLGVAAAAFLIFLGSIFLYYQVYQNSLFRYDDGKLYIKGTVLTEEGRILRDSLKARGQNYGDATLVSNFGTPDEEGVREQVWLEDSIKQSSFRLTFIYIALVVALGCTILSLAALL